MSALLASRPSNGRSDSDTGSIDSKHSLRVLPARHPHASAGGDHDEPPHLSGAPLIQTESGLLARPLTHSPGTDSESEPEFRNTITGSRASRNAAALARRYADSDDEPNWSDLPGRRPSDEPVRIDIVGGGRDASAVDAETKAMIMQERRRVLIRTGSQLLLLFLMCALALVLALWLGLPVIDPEDRSSFKIPRSFDELKALNAVLDRYKASHGKRIFFCWIVFYLFLQAFSIPGSMYMSILAGAIWGVGLALPIVVSAIATGATLCYLISSQLGELLVAVPSWKVRADSWKERLGAQDNLLSYLVIIRMSPVPPHFIVNIIAPHLGIPIPMFWLSTALGVTAVSFIHVTIGQKLDEMTSSEDFHLLSWHNFLLLSGVVLAAAAPIAIRHFSSAPPLEEPEGRGQIALGGEEGPLRAGRTGRGSRIARRDEDDLEDPLSDDELPSVAARPTSQLLTTGAEADLTPWQRSPGLGSSAVRSSRIYSEVDADDVVQNPFDSDDDDNSPSDRQRRAAAAAAAAASESAAPRSGRSKAAQTLGIENVTAKAAKVLGLKGSSSSNASSSRR